MSDVLAKLSALIDQRRQASAEESYVASLFGDGLDRILKKIGEEATETVIAAKGGDPREGVYETADLWFHSLVMLKFLDIEPAEVLAELERRFGHSGLDEKAARTRKSQ